MVIPVEEICCDFLPGCLGVGPGIIGSFWFEPVLLTRITLVHHVFYCFVHAWPKHQFLGALGTLYYPHVPMCIRFSISVLKPVGITSRSPYMIKPSVSDISFLMFQYSRTSLGTCVLFFWPVCLSNCMVLSFFYLLQSYIRCWCVIQCHCHVNCTR